MLDAQAIVRGISFDTGIMSSHLLAIIRTAPIRYKEFTIPKKSGGVRDVAQPAREVKAIQRWLIKSLTPLLPVHEATTAYRSNSSIRHNANQHIRSNFFLKIDFVDFFPSILCDDIVRHLECKCGDSFDESARRLIAHCLCWAPKRLPPLRLCIGAPSSPLVSNSILYDFDLAISKCAIERGVVYTRYADDLTFSCPDRGRLDEMLELVKSQLSELDYPKIRINPAKTVFASRKGRRVVTGIVLTPDRKLSVGRDRKKLIRAMYFRLMNNLLDEDSQERLAGMLAFVDNIEPGYSSRLARSYQSSIERRGRQGA